MRAALAILVLLGGCAAQAQQAERITAEGLDVLENTSQVALTTCRQYLGGTVRVGPLLEWIRTDEQRAAYSLLFGGDQLELPE